MAWYQFHQMGNHFHGITPVSDEDVSGFFLLDDFEPEAIPHWKPPHVQISNDRKRKRGDFPCFTNLPPVLNARALEALRPLLAHCDILPLLCDEEPLVAINPPLLANALDHAESKIDWFSGWVGESALTIHRYVLRGEQARSQAIFRLPEERNLVILSEDFREAVEKHELKGLYFEPLDATWKP